MARIMTIDSIKKKIEIQEEKVNNARIAYENACSKLDALNEMLAEKEGAIEQKKNMELLYQLKDTFGEDITPDRLKEMLNTIMINDEVSKYINSEKAKQDNSDEQHIDLTEIE